MNLIISITNYTISQPNPINNNLNYHINSNYTKISYYLQNHISKTSYQFSIKINPYNKKILITLKKITFTISLFNYTIKTKKITKLFKILKLK